MKAKLKTEILNNSIRITLKHNKEVKCKGKPMAGCSFEELIEEAKERGIDPKNKGVQDLRSEIQKNENGKGTPAENEVKQHGVKIKRKFGEDGEIKVGTDDGIPGENKKAEDITAKHKMERLSGKEVTFKPRFKKDGESLTGKIVGYTNYKQKTLYAKIDVNGKYHYKKLESL